jgi:NitT/TauT family transport system substrate-binding protein
VRTSLFRFFFALASAALMILAPLVVLGQGGQPPAPLPSGQGAITPLAPDAMFTVAVAMPVVEAAPIHIADQGPSGAGFQVINGGVRTVALKGAHAAGNATTQMLRVLGDNPNVRLLFTLVNGNYRIVAKRSAGIARLADLKGKRVVVPRDTSANYYLVAMLRSAGLQESDVTLVTAPATAMAAAMVKGDADAISMWEPESENAVHAIGEDAIIFQDNKVYRELYSVYSTTDVMTDPRRRKELVAFVAATLAAAADLQKDPKRFFPLISEKTKHPQEQIARSWEHHSFPLGVAPDLLDLITEEEKWVAAQQNRAPRGRAELAGFIDTTILEEAQALNAKR